YERQRAGWSKRTAEVARTNLAALDRDPLGAVPVADLDRVAVQVAIGRWVTEGKSPSRIGQLFRTVRAVANDAAANKARPDKINLTGVKLPRMAAKRGTYLKADQRRRLVEAARAHSPEALAMVLLGMDAGLRLSEVLGLNIESVKADRVHVWQVVERDQELRP